MMLENTAGDRNRNRKLSSADVRAIREAVAKGKAPGELAKKYKVHQQTIYKVITRQNWKSVE
jgi:Mor family transcriptional regulator